MTLRLSEVRWVFILFVGSFIAAMVFGHTSASATIIFEDDFNRVDNEIIGEDWIETDPNDVDIVSNQLKLAKNGGAATTQNPLSTTGYENIMLTYDWWGDDNDELGDVLEVYWSDDGTNFDLLISHDLTSSGFGNINLSALGADDLATIAIRFTLAASDGNDLAFIDNVLLAGDLIEILPPPPVGVPEPGSISLFGIGLAGLGVISRRRRKRANAA